jgi:hypothetical protein
LRLGEKSDLVDQLNRNIFSRNALKPGNIFKIQFFLLTAEIKAHIIKTDWSVNNINISKPLL